jgi:hypothetical protein
VGLSIVGQRQYNQEQINHGQPAGELLRLHSVRCEFLQMFAYVILTALLYQIGSAESKKLGESETVDRDPRLSQGHPDTPWPVRKGGLILKLYEHSLGLALLLLFLLSFWLPAWSGAREYSKQELAHSGQAVTLFEYLGKAQFWFESFQNWQSEFFSIGMMVVLSIFLRERGSSESKPVDSPHRETGHL